MRTQKQNETERKQRSPKRRTNKRNRGTRYRVGDGFVKLYFYRETNAYEKTVLLNEQRMKSRQRDKFEMKQISPTRAKYESYPARDNQRNCESIHEGITEEAP